MIFCLGIFPFGIWSLATRSAQPVAPIEHSNYIAHNYLFHFFREDVNDADSPMVTVSSFAQRVSHNLNDLASRSAGQLFFPWLTPKQSLIGKIISIAVPLILLIGIAASLRPGLAFTEIYFLFSIGLILIWGYSPTRFLVILMPLLIQYFRVGIEYSAKSLSNLIMAKNKPDEVFDRSYLAYCASFAILTFALIGFFATHVTMLSVKFQLPFAAKLAKNFVMFDQQRNLEEIIQWTKKNIPSDEVIATDVPALVFLHTNHRTVHLIDPEKDKELWRQLGIKYVVLSGITTVHPLEGFPIFFSTNDQKAVIYKVQ